MKERKGFFRFLFLTGFIMSWLIEALIYNLKGEIHWLYCVTGIAFLILAWMAWNE